MRVRTLDAALWLPLPPAEAFTFFGDAGNLDAITPAWLNFRITTPRPIAMAPGALIDYEIRLRGIPVRWRTRITYWEPPRAFVDEQLRGPYRLWRHRHTFEPANGGTWVRDHVDYAVPGGPLEPLLHRCLVGPDLRAIFAHRQRRIRELLAPGSDPGGDSVALGARPPATPVAPASAS